eukprot:451460-Hanusia_phi.AAC.7
MESEPVTREILLKLLLKGLGLANSLVCHEKKGLSSDSHALVQGNPNETGEGGEALQNLGLGQFRISLCGRILQQRADMSRKAQMEAFEKHVVTLDQFLANPLDIASSPELYVSVDGDVSKTTKSVEE